MSFTLSGTNLDAPDAAMLAGFYRRLLGWAVEVDEPGRVVLLAGCGISSHRVGWASPVRLEQIALVGTR